MTEREFQAALRAMRRQVRRDVAEWGRALNRAVFVALAVADAVERQN